jgi:predicted ATP-binding protein involved in virulence
MEHFITKIKIEKVRHLENIEICLSETERRHLLITGKNGSGKTSLLEAVRETLSVINNKHWKSYRNYVSGKDDLVADVISEIFDGFPNGIDIVFNFNDDLDNFFVEGRFITAYFPAYRKANIALARGVEDVKFDISYELNAEPAKNLIKYMVHLKTQQAYARQENDLQIEKNIQAWFSRFEKALRVLLENESLKMEYDYRNYNFLLHQNGRLPFGFNELSDGYSSVIQIVTNLIMRMEQNWLLKGTISNYNVEGVALIDELETHLHIELQRKILPFLVTFFPRVQFIVSTHSPYVLTSISNATVFDLEKRVTFDDMSLYSINDVSTGYFDSEDYSQELAKKLNRYRELLDLSNPSDEERAERAELRMELKNIQGSLVPQIKNAFEDLESRR